MQRTQPPSSDSHAGESTDVSRYRVPIRADHASAQDHTLIAGGRRHDLDALRGFAMVLGIGLHAALAFFPTFWPVQDRTSSIDGLYDEFFHAVHGFRMPLFFLLSGYFTAMLWRRRGLRALLRHRVRRIVLPLAFGLVAILPIASRMSDQAFAGAADAVDSSIRLPVNVSSGGLSLGSWLDNIGHLWFLSYLLWLMAGFAVVVLVIERRSLRNRSGSPRTGDGPWWLLWSLVPLTLLGQWLMGNRGEIPVFGPDISLGLIPPAHVLGYYALFFAFGALLYGRRRRSGELLVDSLGRGWWFVLPVTIIFILPLGLGLTFAEDERSWELASAAQVAYTWAMCIGLIGLFRSIFSRERRGVRYLSDASYWMYLTHVPLLIGAQMLVRDWDMAAVVKFLLTSIAVSALLLATYRVFVRYTPIGTLLNGKRTRSRIAAGVTVRQQ